MTNRRDFLKKAAMLSGSMGAFTALPPALARALEIEPKPGSTFRDAKHVVILMQENRSFDHMFGNFRGVRGLDDPRAITLPNGNPVFLQTDEAGRIYAPFPLDIHNTQSTWMGDLPHGRPDQVEAGNQGKHDRWLKAKRSRRNGFGELPLTLGFYEKRDIPFYHAFADAFTLCDQHFCSVQSSTTPNRSFHWTGTNRPNGDPAAPACMTNGELDHRNLGSWTTFPERLQAAGISWKVYQNEIALPTGFRGEEASWLGNFGDNPLEYFSQYHAKQHPRHLAYLKAEAERLREALEKAESAPADATKNKEAIAEREKMRSSLRRIEEQLAAMAPLEDPKALDLHQRAFTTNEADPRHRRLTSIQYRDGDTEENVNVPEGDVLYQFRKDVEEGKLPTVSWLVAGQQFSDHPSAAWYGAWYVSEILDILTKHPDVWRDTIFILNYDENDGYFDHVPPFVPPAPDKVDSGAVSPGIETAAEFDAEGRPIGLGYRVPLIIASPWTRGGYVCSEVFDLTSVLRFLEVFLEGKGSQPVRESNISSWRRTVCGDLTSAFRPSDGQGDHHPHPLVRDEFIEEIHRARKKALPSCQALDEATILAIRQNPRTAKEIPAQEPGQRPSCALAYELQVDAKQEDGALVLTFTAATDRFGEQSLGAPFQVYAPGDYLVEAAKVGGGEGEAYERMRRWSFAVGAGAQLSYAWPLSAFRGGQYHLEVHGPNGFYRVFRGRAADPGLQILCRDEGEDQLVFQIAVSDQFQGDRLKIRDCSYGREPRELSLSAGQVSKLTLSLKESQRWYDFEISLAKDPSFTRRYAGRMENGSEGQTDPSIGSRAGQVA